MNPELFACKQQLHLYNVCSVYLDVSASRDEHCVVRGEVQVGHPSTVERVHGILSVPGTDLQESTIQHAPQLKHTKPYNIKCYTKINKKSYDIAQYKVHPQSVFLYNASVFLVRI